jgi:hypothetical protein
MKRRCYTCFWDLVLAVALLFTTGLAAAAPTLEVRFAVF